MAPFSIFATVTFMYIIDVFKSTFVPLWRIGVLFHWAGAFDPNFHMIRAQIDHRLS